MEFVGDVPPGLRKGQTLQINLTFGDERQALLLPLGGFFQQTKRKTVSRIQFVSISTGNR